MKQVAQIVTTDGVDGWTYGTLLALELNKGAENVAALEGLLNHELSTLDFMFLQRFRSMQLATLRSDEHSARTFTYTHDQTNGAHLILETRCAQNDRCMSPEQSGWIMCSCDVPEAHRKEIHTQIYKKPLLSHHPQSVNKFVGVTPFHTLSKHSRSLAPASLLYESP